MGNCFNCNASGFTDYTFLTVCFFTEIKSKQQNQGAPDEEVTFQQHDISAEDGEGSDNGINPKSVVGW